MRMITKGSDPRVVARSATTRGEEGLGQGRQAARLAFLGALLLAAAPAAVATEIDRSFHQRFDVESGARLELEHEDGDVVITPWAENVIEVDVRYRVEYKRVGVGVDPDLEVRFEQRGGVVRVIGEEKSAGGVGFFSMNQIEYVYRVSAPAYVVLDLDGEDGDVEVSGWRGAITARNDDGDFRLADLQVPRLRLDVEDGDVEIEGCEGEMDLEVDDGDVTVRDCRGERIRIDGQDGRVRIDDCEGDFEISTDDGDVELSGLRAGKLEVHTSDGRIEIDIDSGLGRLDADVSADDGDVDLRLGDGVGADFTLSSDDGDIRVDAEAAGLEQGRKRATGRLGDGGGRIQVSTNSGRITLRQ